MPDLNGRDCLHCASDALTAPGRKVKGKIVERGSPGLAWVDIDGHRLLAQVSQDSTLGLERGFLIVSLSPEIVLRELSGRPAGLDVLV